MRFATAQGARGGIGQAINTLARGAGGNDYNDTLQALATLDQRQSAARYNNARAGISEDELDARGGVMGALEGIVQPGQEANMATLFRASANPNLRDITQGAGDMITNTARQQSLDELNSGGDIGTINALTAIGAGKQRQPFSLNETGVLNQESGEVNYTPGHEALANKRDQEALAAPYVANSGTFLNAATGEATTPAPYTQNADGVALNTVTGGQQADTGVLGALANVTGGADIDPKLNAQLDEIFLENAVDEKGKPVIDPFTGRVAMNPNQQRKTNFLRWWNQNKGQFPDINQALPFYIDTVESNGAPVNAAPAGASSGSGRRLIYDPTTSSLVPTQ